MPPTPVRKIRMTDEEWAALERIATRQGKERAEVMLDAIKEKYPEDFNPTPRREGRPSNLPPGWKSRLYRDRYQLVAHFDDAEGFIFNHFHEEAAPLDKSRMFGTIVANAPAPVEIYVMDVPARYNQEQVAQTLRLAFMEWWQDQPEALVQEQRQIYKTDWWTPNQWKAYQAWRILWGQGEGIAYAASITLMDDTEQIEKVEALGYTWDATTNEWIKP